MTLRLSSGGNPMFRKLAFLALRLTSLPLLFREVLQRKKVTIIVYHAPSAQIFDTHVRVLKRAYNIVSLSAYLEARQRGDFSKLPPKALIITLDDGHRSNYALKEVLEKHNVPLTIFLCSGLVGTHRRFWFRHDATGPMIQQLKDVPDAERLTVLRMAGFEETKEFEERQALSNSEVEELKAKTDFQSHTVYHPILPRCVHQRAEAEITNSKTDLETRLAREVYAFAYPDGAYSEREVHLAEKAGYKCALTLDRGSNTGTTPLLRLRRTCIPDHADLHELLVKTSGLWGKIRAVLERSVVTRRSSPEYRA